MSQPAINNPPPKPTTTAGWRAWMAAVAVDALTHQGLTIKRLLVSSVQLCDDDMRRCGLEPRDPGLAWYAWAEVRPHHGKGRYQLVSCIGTPWDRPWVIGVGPAEREPRGGDLFGPPPPAEAS